MVECCNALRPMCQVSSSNSLLLPYHCLRVMHCISCHHVHFICIHVRLMHPSIFPVVRFAIRHSYVTRCPFCLFSRAGFKRSQNGSVFAERPWYSTVSPPVKFRCIRSPFDSPTVELIAVSLTVPSSDVSVSVTVAGSLPLLSHSPSPVL